MSTARGLRPLVLLTLGAALLTGGCAATGGGPEASAPEVAGGSGAASCAMVVEYDGRRYVGYGELRRTPTTTGRTLSGVLPSCDDTGGGQPTESEQVTLEELEDLPVDTALLWHGSLLLREGIELPQEAEVWFTAPRCSHRGAADLAGDWLGILPAGEVPSGPDGALLPPYRVVVQVTDGSRYDGSTVTVRARSDTAPGLTQRDVRRSLWRGGSVTGTVECRGGRFHALTLMVPAS